MRNTRRLTVFLAAAMLAVAVAPAGLVRAQAAEQSYQIPAGDLGGALAEFATQAHLQVMYSPELVKGKRAQAIAGALSAETALQRLLDGSGLVAEKINETTFVLKSATTHNASNPADDRAPAATPPAEPTELGAVMVTGSLLSNPGLYSTSPVESITPDQLKLSGSPTVEDYLQALPQLFAGDNKSTNVANAASGAATLNLRGLDPKRTLILVNGRRFIAYGPSGITDINNIPTSAIDHIEIMTGGGSSIYGADAVAGVVNFVLKSHVDGLHAGFDVGISGKGDAADRSAWVTFGSTGERSSVWLNVMHQRRSVLRAKERSDQAVRMVDMGGTLVPTGTNARLGGTLPAIPTPDGNGGWVLRNYALDNLVPRPFDPASDPTLDFTGEYALQTPLTRTNVFGQGTFEFNDRVSAFFEAAANHIQSDLAMSRTSINARQTQNVQGIPANASWISPEIRDLLNARPDPNAPFTVQLLVPESFPKRSIDFTRDVFRLVGGLEGSLGGSWKWEASYNWGRTETREVQVADVSRRTFAYASTPDPNDPTKCAVPDPRCVLLTSLTDWTPEQIAYLRSDNVSVTHASQRIFDVHVTGSLFDLPAGSVDAAFGADWRSESSRDQPGPVLLDFASSGFGERSATSGSYSVKEAYTEFTVPLLSGVRGAEYLGLNMGYRHSDYSTSGGSNTYKFGGNWTFNSDWTVRGIYQRAVRAPNISELFGGEVEAFPEIVDPCSLNGNPSGDRIGWCQSQGIPAEFVGQFNQTTAWTPARITSNPQLKPEKSDTLTYGVVFTPGALPDFSATLDYFDIKIDGAISRMGGGPNGVLASCFASADPHSSYCQMFSRSATTYEIIDLRVPLVNAGSLRSTGVDASVRYGFDLSGLGIGSRSSRVNLSLLSTWTQRNTLKATDLSDTVNLAGTVGGDFPAMPRWKAHGIAQWSSGPVDVSWSVDFLGGVDDRKYADAKRAGAADPKAGIAYPTVPAFFYHNLMASYQLGSVRMEAGVRNLFDKRPPQLSTAIFLSNTDPTTYDTIGRYFFAGATIDF